MPEGVTAGLRRACLTVDIGNLCRINGDAFDFDASAFGKPADFDARSRRRVAGKKFGVNAVDRFEIVEIFDENRRFYDVFASQTDGAQKGGNIVERLPRLIRCIAADFSRCGIHPELSRKKDGVSDADGLGVRSDGFGRVFGRNDDFFHGASFLIVGADKKANRKMHPNRIYAAAAV